MAETDREENGVDHAEHDSDSTGVPPDERSERAATEQHTEYGHDDREMARAEDERHHQPLPTLFFTVKRGRNRLVT
jgi:hypothetical protein